MAKLLRRRRRNNRYVFKTAFLMKCGYLHGQSRGCVTTVLLPEKLSIGEKEYFAYYIYAAATAESYRKQGIMGSLLEFTSALAADRKADYLFLVPATENLFDYYEKFGFYKALYAEKPSLNWPAVSRSTLKALSRRI